MQLKVAIVEDNPQYRASLEQFFEHAPGYTLAGSFGSAVTALREAERGDPPDWDLVLMDLEMPQMNGIEATRRLKALKPDLSVVVLTVFEEPAVILQAISAGADGYMLKKSSARELLAQLGAIAAGGSPLTAGVARTVLDLLRSTAPADATVSPARLELTGREQDVLRCLVRGKTYQQTADALDIGLETVRSHIKAIYRKLRVHSVVEAVTRAVREGLV